VLKLWRKIPLLLRRALSLLLVAVIIWPFDHFIEGNSSLGYLENILVLTGINIILAVALNVVNGFTGQFSLGHVGFYAVGAYVAAAMATYGHDKLFPMLPVDGTPVSALKAAYPIIFMMICSGIVAALIGLLVGLPSLRLRGDYLAIITLGFAQIIQVILRNMKVIDGATSFTGIDRGDHLLLTPHLTGIFWVYFVAAVVIWIAYGLRFSTHGLAFLAVREDEVAAEAMGINTTNYKVTAFVISAFLTGVAGALFGLYSSSLSNDQFSFMRGIDIVVMVVLGGLGSISGVTIAAIFLTGVPEILRPIAQYRLVVFPLLLILLMLTRPQGIFGQLELSKAWFWGQVNAVRGWFSGSSRLADKRTL
jgi:branched-chain amino acid transport system permease protein